MFKLKERAQRKRYPSSEEQLLTALGLVVFFSFVLVAVIFLAAWVQGGL
jgi:uncharacterized membrane protein YidH (DUF202 family)